MADLLLNVRHGALHPVHHALVHDHGVAVHPGGGHVVGVDPVGISPAGIHEVAGFLNLLSSLIELVPVGHSGGHGFRIVGAQHRLGDGAAVDQHTGGGLIAQGADLAIGGGHGLQRVLVLVGNIRLCDAQLGDGQCHVYVGVDVLQRVVSLHQKHVNLLVGGGAGLLGQGLVQLLLVYAVLVGIDDPVDLGAVLQIGDGLVAGELLHLRVVVVELLLELLVPYVDVENLSATAGFIGSAAGLTRFAVAARAAAAGKEAERHQRRKCKAQNSLLHNRCLLLFYFDTVCNRWDTTIINSRRLAVYKNQQRNIKFVSAFRCYKISSIRR